jgi:hypothetical protein
MLSSVRSSSNKLTNEALPIKVGGGATGQLTLVPNNIRTGKRAVNSFLDEAYGDLVDAF